MTLRQLLLQVQWHRHPHFGYEADTRFQESLCRATKLRHSSTTNDMSLGLFLWCFKPGPNFTGAPHASDIASRETLN